MTPMLRENLALLETKGHEKLAAQLRDFQPLSKLQGSLETGDLNFQIGPNQMMYDPDILSSISDEVSNFAKTPNRIFLPDRLRDLEAHENSPEWDTMGKLCNNKFNRAVKDIVGDKAISDTPEEGGGYLLSFGVGLGIQFIMYLDHFPVRNLILVEPVLEMLYHSFSSINWSSFFHKLEARGGSVTFITTADPSLAGAEAVHALRGKDFSLIDGTYVTQHYNSDFFEQALLSFQASVPILHQGMGFIEDEVIMYQNGTGNLRKYDWRILPAGSPPAPLPYPAFIIGAGPSLDSAIQTIKQNKDKAFLFSGGTALSALFTEGIIPDFHCEAENTLYTREVLSKLDREKLKQVTLIATNTVHPDIAGWFKDVIFCTRDSVTPTRLFHDRQEIIPLAAANVSCLTNRAAMALGFQRLICFGMDFGSKKPDKHHAKSSIYNTTDDSFYKKGFYMQEMGLQVEGQKRKKIYTNVPFQYARQFLEQMLASVKGFEVYNTADGAKILGTKTLELDQIQLQKPFRSKEETLANIYARMPLIPVGQKLDFTIAVEFEEKLKQQATELVKETENIANVSDLYRKLQPAIQRGNGDIEHGMEAALRIFMSGSLIQIMQTLTWLEKRLSKDEFEQIWPDLRQAVGDNLALMQQAIDQMFVTVKTSA